MIPSNAESYVFEDAIRDVYHDCEAYAKFGNSTFSKTILADLEEMFGKLRTEVSPIDPYRLAMQAGAQHVVNYIKWRIEMANDLGSELKKELEEE